MHDDVGCRLPSTYIAGHLHLCSRWLRSFITLLDHIADCFNKDTKQREYVFICDKAFCICELHETAFMAMLCVKWFRSFTFNSTSVHCKCVACKEFHFSLLGGEFVEVYTACCD